MNRHIYTACLLALALAGCPRKEESAAQARGPAPSKSEEPEQHKDEPAEHEALPSKVRLSDDVVKAAGIRLAPVASVSLPATVNLTGELVADPDRAAQVASRVSGRIVEVRFKEGKRVKAGALLAIIESPELARARADHTTARARAEAAKRNVERLERVAAKGLAAGQEVENARAEARSLGAAAEAARLTLLAFGPGAADAKPKGARLSIRAPIDGFVLRRDAIRGQTVTDAHILAEIADLDRAFFLGRLFEKDLARVQAAAAAEVRLNAYPTDVLQGTVESIGKQLDPAARTVVARIAVANRTGLLKVGLFGTATVVVTGPSAATEPRLVVPLGAVTKIAEHDVVFVRHPDGDYEVHPVTLGRSAAGKVEVLTGLRQGEQVVIEGVFTLKSAVLKSTFGEED